MRIVGCAALLLAVLFACPARLAPSARPGGDSSFVFAELEHPVRIDTDRYGVPHIRAETLPCLYFAWGFVSARDRLWQMLARRQAVRGQMWR